MRDSDWPRVCEIYRQGLATGIATFETEAPEWSTWDAGHLRHSRLVARGENARSVGGRRSARFRGAHAAQAWRKYRYTSRRSTAVKDWAV